MNLTIMDDTDSEHIHYATPMLTPHVSDRSTSEYLDLDCSYSQLDHLQQMSNITRDLQEVANICCQLDDNESESDVQDQQPTEATDDSNDPCQIQTATENILNDSLHPQTLDDEEHDDIISTMPESEPVEESSSTIVSDTESIQVETRHPRQTLRYSLSRCVPCTDEQDEISIIKETLTSDSTVTLDFTEIVKKDKSNLGHIMISYNHSTKAICTKISKQLKHRNYIVWIDQDNISGDILTSMASAVENSFVVLMAINEHYYESRYCRLEAEYSVEQNKASIPMIMQSGYKPAGWLGIINGAKLHIDFSQLPFDEAFNLLIREIEAVRISLGAEENDHRINTMPVNNQMLTTTMDNSWSHFQSVHEWTTDDVIEWLNREKLEVFEEGLRYFTGATLWQLYKIKLESAPDYYRMIETLLPPTMPLRLVNNLRLYAALEALFSSSFQTIHR